MGVGWVWVHLLWVGAQESFSPYWPRGSIQLPNSFMQAGQRTHYFSGQALMCAVLAVRWGMLFSQASHSGCPFRNCMAWGCCLPAANCEANFFADELAAMPAGSRHGAPAFWYDPAGGLAEQLPDSHGWRAGLPGVLEAVEPLAGQPGWPGDLAPRMDAMKAHLQGMLHRAGQGHRRSIGTQTIGPAELLMQQMEAARGNTPWPTPSPAPATLEPCDDME
jgi:hypothetical protein